VVGGASSNPSVTVTWLASSGGNSGLAGYDTLWDHAATTILDGIVDTGSGLTSSTTSLAVSNQDWYFHIRAKDGAGNLSATQHLGPFRIGLCNSFAANSAYGVGKPGTNGIPQLVALDDPILGYASSVQIQNGRPGATPTLVLGAASALIPFDGSTILVFPQIVLVIPIPIAADGTLILSGTLPADSALCGLTIYHQVLIPDPAATGYYKLAFTPGLARTFGS